MLGGIGLVVNPGARFHRKNAEVRTELRRILFGHGTMVESESVDALDAIAQRFKDQQIEVLAISGGDGTGSVTLERFLAVYGDTPLPAIALIRGGTMNTVANGLGIPRQRPERLLSQIVLARKAGRELPLREVDCMVADGHIGFMVGTGALHGFLDVYYEAGAGNPTPATAARVLGHGAVSALLGGNYSKRMAGRVVADVVADGEPWPRRDYLAVAAGTIQEIGLGFRPYHMAGEVPGRFHLLGIHMSTPKFALLLPRVHRAKPLGDENVQEQLAERAVISSPEGLVRYIVDGELYHKRGDLEITVGPRLRVVIP
jgi:diacylglycerol kinase family enzyme